MMPDEMAKFEQQFDAMRNIISALLPLEKAAQEAVLDWVDAQIDRKSEKNADDNQSSSMDVSGGHEGYKGESGASGCGCGSN